MHLLDRSYDALQQAVHAKCCETPIAYLSQGEGDDGIVDALTVVLKTITPEPGQAGQMFRNRAVFDVRLREAGWPMVSTDNTSIDMPDPKVQHALAGHAWAHAEAVYRRLVYLAQQRELQPRGMRVMDGVVGTMRMLSPQGGVVGMVVPVTITMPW